MSKLPSVSEIQQQCLFRFKEVKSKNADLREINSDLDEPSPPSPMIVLCTALNMTWPSNNLDYSLC